MTNTLPPITEANALKAYTNADAKGKAMLIDLHGPDVFNRKITDRVKTFDDALNVIGLGQSEFKTYCGMLSPDEVSYLQVKIIARALNEGWTPDWNNSSQYKYYPFFDMRKGFSYNDYGFNNSLSFVGSRLCYKSRELAEYAGTQFTEIYKTMFTL